MGPQPSYAYTYGGVSMGAVVGAVSTQAADLFELTKPRIALVALITAFTGMYLAAGPTLAPGFVLGTLVGVGLAASSAGLLNNYLDRDIDPLMSRTAKRATADGRIEPALVLGLGLGLGAASFAVITLVANLFAAALAVATIYFYVVIYTLWLKRRTDLCTEIGGVAGALPPLIGWAAVTGRLDTPALLLFLIMFLWQPPHFWVLALLSRDQYQRAGIPMLPVTAGTMLTKAKMILYTAALLPAVIALFYTGVVGTTYLGVAIATTLIYLVWTADFCRRPLSRRQAINLFLYSIAWLLILFTTVIIDSH